MKLRIERNALAEAVAWAARTLPGKPTNPVLAGVLVEASEDQVTLSSSDQEVSSQANLEAEVGEPGAAVVPGRLLADIAKALPGRPVSITLEGTRLVIQSGATRFTLPTLPVGEYPALPPVPPMLGTVAGHTLSDAVSQVAIAASREDSLPVLTGILMEFRQDTVTLAATDRYRLAVREFPWQAAGRDTDNSVLIRSRALVDLAKPLAGTDSVEIGLGEGGSLIGIAAPSRRSTTPVLDGDFPDYRRLLPTDAATIAVVPTSDLMDSVKRVKLVVDRPNLPILLEFADGEVVLRAGGGADAGASDALECELQGDPITIAFNPEYLLDGLAGLSAASVRIAMREPSRPAVLSVADSEQADYRYLLMPVRTSG